MRLSALGRRIVAAVIGVFALGAGGLHAQEVNPKRTIVIFGGFGYFDGAQHPWLHDLIRRDTNQQSKYGVEGRQLEEAVTKAAQSALASRDGRERREGAFARWSHHPVVFNSADLGTAFKRATGEDPVSTSAMFTEFDRAYMVVLSSGFEHHAVLRTPHERGVTFHAYTSVSVSASLVDLKGSGNIVLSASVLGEHEVNQLPAEDKLDSAVWAGRYGAAYGAAAGRALILLRRLADKSDAKDLERTSDTFMVTGATVLKLSGPAAAASQNAARLFDWRLADSIGDFCSPLNQCAEGSKGCTAMTGYLVSAMSQVLSQAGHKVLPPITWRTGTRDSKDLVQYKLHLPSTQLPELGSSTDLDFDPRRATYKVVATLAGITFDSSPERNGLRVTDVYSAIVNSWMSTTDPKTCASRPEDQRLLDTKRAGLGFKTDVRLAKDPPLGDETRRLLYMRAIHDGATKIAASLGGR
jgi:hypothetical protein